MARLNLTLRTLLAYLDDTLDPDQARQLGEKVAQSEPAQELIERIKKVTRRRGLSVPMSTGPDDHLADPNRVAEYLSDTLSAAELTEFEETCLTSDVHLAEAAACHQILTLVLTEPVRVPPTANQRMYKLVEAPASVQHRKPGRTLPVGMPPDETGDGGETDASDAALLLGMRRYSRSEPRGNRLALAGAVTALAAALAVAVYMSLPAKTREVAVADTKSPETPAVPAVTPPPVAVRPKPAPVPDPKPAPTPEPAQPPVQPPVPEATVAVAPPPRPRRESPVEPPEPVVKQPEKPDVAAPLGARAKIGRLETENALVLARTETTDWRRFTRDVDPDFFSSDALLCLPGYKANLLLDSGVGVNLWGNVPEILPDPLLEVRVRFHSPEKGEGNAISFDADLTLEAGRIYLTARKPAGARVRVRANKEVWDFTIPDEKSEVMVQITTEFIPGTPFVKGGMEKSRTVLTAVVTRGKAGLTVPRRGLDYPALPAQTLVRWDSNSGKVSTPEPVPKADAGRYDRVFLLPDAELGKVVQRGLSDMVNALADRDGIRLLLAEILTEKFDPNKQFQVRFAIYDQAALMNADGDVKALKTLVERLGETERPFARVAAITALANWIAQAPGNSTVLRQLFVKELNYPEPDADQVIRLLRGYLPPGKPNPDDLDQLVGMLSSKLLPIRELALWNLLTFVDPESARMPSLFANVGDSSGERYDRFVRAWKARADELKKQSPKMK